MGKLKVCAIIGATHSDSNTVYFVSGFLKKFRMEMKAEIEVELYNLHEYKVENCIGCYECMRMRECVLIDKMEVLKRSMLESNIIIWGSPVYMNGISGVMKSFIDRLHSWTKLLCLRGKYGIVLSSSSHKIYDMYVKEYLIWIQSVLGLINIGTYNICVDIPQELYSHCSNEIIQQYAHETMLKYKANYCKTTPMHEQIFMQLRNSVLLLKKEQPENKVVQYWEKNNLIDCETFQQSLNENSCL